MNSTEIINKLAERRAMGAESLRVLWKQALASFPEMADTYLEQLGRALPSPAAGRQFSQYLSREKDIPSALQGFFRDINESEESLENWLDAFSVLALHLENTSHRPTLRMAMGYLHCCEAVAHTGARYETFPMTVETMLETYGYEGESDSGA